MNILNITNLTDNPSGWLKDKIDYAIEEYEKELDTTFSTDIKNSIHSYFDDMIENFEENGKVSEASSFVDNLLVNHDYYATVKEIVDSVKEAN